MNVNWSISLTACCPAFETPEDWSWCCRNQVEKGTGTVFDPDLLTGTSPRPSGMSPNFAVRCQASDIRFLT